MLTFNSMFAGSTIETFVKLTVSRREQLGVRAITPVGIANGTTVKPVINHDRLIVQCPFIPCNGAELVDTEYPYFYCLSCYNETIGNKWIPIELPDDTEITEIDRLLGFRQVHNRNWIGETAEEILIENVFHEV